MFIEVQYRRQGSLRYSAYSITAKKKQKLYNTAEEYLIEKGLNKKYSFLKVLIVNVQNNKIYLYIKDIFI